MWFLPKVPKELIFQIYGFAHYLSDKIPTPKPEIFKALFTLAPDYPSTKGTSYLSLRFLSMSRISEVFTHSAYVHFFLVLHAHAHAHTHSSNYTGHNSARLTVCFSCEVFPSPKAFLFWWCSGSQWKGRNSPVAQCETS